MQCKFFLDLNSFIFQWEKIKKTFTHVHKTCGDFNARKSDFFPSLSTVFNRRRDAHFNLVVAFNLSPKKTLSTATFASVCSVGVQSASFLPPWGLFSYFTSSVLILFHNRKDELLVRKNTFFS